MRTGRSPSDTVSVSELISLQRGLARAGEALETPEFALKHLSSVQLQPELCLGAHRNLMFKDYFLINI